MNILPKHELLKKKNNVTMGNNLKLDNFLLAKNDTSNLQYLTTVNNVVLKPTTTSNVTNAPIKTNILSKLNIRKKTVKVDKNHLSKTLFQGKLLPKINPKQSTSNPSKHTSVQLLKLGGTYHSLNQLSEEQMKIVNQALMNITDPENVPLEPTYDPVTNTRFIYKVVSPKDLTVVGKNKIVIKDKKGNLKKNITKKCVKKPIKFLEGDSESHAPAETKVTRSGRKVKLPKQILPEETSLKSRNERRATKNGRLLTCFQCSTDFVSLYRLQRHYENYPTHIPMKIHSNLYHCFLAIIKSGSEKDRASIFVQQLEKLIEKLKSLLPCLLKKIDGSEGNFCTINDDIGRLFGMNPGRYNLNMDALNCTKDKDGCCRHNPPKVYQLSSDLNKPSQLWLSKHNEETANNGNETEDCARINSVDKWPNINKKLWKLKQEPQTSDAKRCRNTSEIGETFIELEKEESTNFNVHNQINLMQLKTSLQHENDNNDKCQRPIHNKESDYTHIENENVSSKKKHMKFYSTHFDIRSSPIKLSSTTFRKFQINPEKLANYGVQVIKNLAFDKQVDIENSQENNMQPNCNNSPDLSNKGKELPYKETNIVKSNSTFINDKDWPIITVSNDTQSIDSRPKSNSLLEPVLLHVTEDSVGKSMLNNDVSQNVLVKTNDSNLPSSQGQSVSQFLDLLVNDCLTYPENEIRNSSVDFHLDLFTFSNT